MKSLKSKNFVSELYSWNHLYYCLNAEGVEALKEYLGMKGQTFIPETFKKREGRKEIVEIRAGGRGRGRNFGRGRGRGRDGPGQRRFGGRVDRGNRQSYGRGRSYRDNDPREGPSQYQGRRDDRDG